MGEFSYLITPGD